MTRGDRLKKARIDAGFRTATDAAREHGWATATYLGHENGTRGIPVETFETYARVFRTDPGWLAFGIDPQESKLANVPASLLREIMVRILSKEGAADAAPEAIAQLIIEIADFAARSGTNGLSTVVDFQVEKIRRTGMQ